MFALVSLGNLDRPVLPTVGSLDVTHRGQDTEFPITRLKRFNSCPCLMSIRHVAGEARFIHASNYFFLTGLLYATPIDVFGLPRKQNTGEAHHGFGRASTNGVSLRHILN